MRLLGLGVALACLPATAFIRNRNTSGVPTRRPDFTGVRFQYHDLTAPGLMNASGGVTISADSDPVGALQAAVDGWTAVLTSNLVFLPLTPTSMESGQPDREHLMSFADTAANRSIVGDAVAVTRTFTNSLGEITDTDILFNPALPFSTTLQTGTFDIQSVAAHELGHALGSSHSGLVSATMFFAVRRANNLQATLTSDDEAFATDVYPDPGVNGRLGLITGMVTFASGGPVPGALVAAVDPATGVILGAITGSDGAFTVSSVPPGRYTLYAEPADGPVEPNQLGAAGQGANTNFLTAVAADAVTVAAGQEATGSLSVEAGNPPLNIRQGGAGPVGSSISFGSGGFVLSRGAAADVVLAGDGLDDPAVTAESISFLGAPITVTGGFRRSVAAGSNLPVIRFSVQVAANAPAGLATVLVRSGSASAAFSGGIRIAPPAPAFTAAGVVNAASFAAGGAAPGEIVSIFGTNLGPAGGAVGALNPGTDRLNTILGGVTVRFNGVRAPLFYASAGQINAQVPFEMAGQPSASVVVTNQLAASQAVSVPIAAAHPAIFVRPGSSQGIIQHQDGSLNSSSNAIARGQAIIIYATGQGAVQPALPTGALASASPLSGAAQAVTAAVGGVPAQVLFGGLTPQFVGLLQVNAIVPTNAPTGGAVPISINVGGVDSQPNVTVAVR